jgi:ribosomal protein L21E
MKIAALILMLAGAYMVLRGNNTIGISLIIPYFVFRVFELVGQSRSYKVGQVVKVKTTMRDVVIERRILGITDEMAAVEERSYNVFVGKWGDWGNKKNVRISAIKDYGDNSQ